MKRILLLQLLLLVFTIYASAQNEIRYASANLNLRSLPNSSSTILTVIPEGTSVTIDEDCNCDWIPVSYNGTIGYVSTKYLSKQKIEKVYPVGEVKYYTNSKGQRVQSPTKYNSVPRGATALCRDGTYSFSRNRRGTCSHHGGVARWL